MHLNCINHVSEGTMIQNNLVKITEIKILFTFKFLNNK